MKIHFSHGVKEDTDGLLHTGALVGVLRVINSCNEFKTPSGIQRLNVHSPLQDHIYFIRQSTHLYLTIFTWEDFLIGKFYMFI